MDTPEPSPNPSTPLASDALPWLADEPAPQLVAVRRHGRAARPAQAPALVNWWVVALTALTAVSLLFGGRGSASQPRELLPIVMIAP